MLIGFAQPAVVQHEAETLRTLDLPDSQQLRASELLNRLLTAPLMRRVWQELYKKKRENHHPSPDYLYPAEVIFPVKREPT